MQPKIPTPDGYYKDTIIRPDGVRIERPWRHNQIQNSFAKFLAGLCKAHNFGPGAGVGINQIAYGAGLDAWYTWQGEPDYGAYGSPAYVELTSTVALPLSLSTGTGVYFVLHVDGTAYEILARVPDEYSTFPATDDMNEWLRPLILGSLDSTLRDHISFGLTVENKVTITLSAGTEIDIRSSVGRITGLGVISYDLMAALGFPRRYITPDPGDDASSTIFQFPSLNSDATVLAAEFARQDIEAANMEFVDPVTWQVSTRPTRAVQIRVVRGQTAEGELHGEFGLYGAYDPVTTQAQMINWVARPQRIPKRPEDMLETTIILVFFEND